jgi:hypothetical protein
MISVVFLIISITLIVLYVLPFVEFTKEVSKPSKSVLDLNEFNKYGVRRSDNKDFPFEKASKKYWKSNIICDILVIVFLIISNSSILNANATAVASTATVDTSGLILPQLLPILIIALLFPIYMYPTKVARRTEHEQTSAIAWLNFLFGGTIILWLVLLVWANSSKPSQPQPVATPQESSLTDKLQELQKLKDQGILTEEEFEAKKKQILNI